MMLHPLLFIPPLDLIRKFASDFRMSDDALFDLAKVLCQVKPKNIFEAGSGLSTYVLLAYFKELAREPALLSLIDDGEWDGKTRMYLSKYFEFELVKSSLLTVPLLPNGWYDFKHNPGVTYDLIVLDGPQSGRNSNEVKELIRQIGNPETTVLFIDDTSRDEEADFVDWCRSIGYERSYEIIDTLFPSRTTTVMNRI